jgi:hypothetical protein
LRPTGSFCALQGAIAIPDDGYDYAGERFDSVSELIEDVYNAKRRRALVARMIDAEAALPNGPPETMRPQRRLLSHRRVSAVDLHRMRVRQRRKWRALLRARTKSK